MADTSVTSRSDNGTLPGTVQGAMLWFNETKDVGVITAQDGEQLPVQGTGFQEGSRPKGRCAGTAVTFRVAEAKEGRHAVDVSVMPETAPRRARLRHARFRSHN